jgi:hypothetical protein
MAWGGAARSTGPFGKLRVPSIAEGLRAQSQSRGLTARRSERVEVNALHQQG